MNQLDDLESIASSGQEASHSIQDIGPKNSIKVHFRTNKNETESEWKREKHPFDMALHEERQKEETRLKVQNQSQTIQTEAKN